MILETIIRLDSLKKVCTQFLWIFFFFSYGDRYTRRNMNGWKNECLDYTVVDITAMYVQLLDGTC